MDNKDIYKKMKTIGEKLNKEKVELNKDLVVLGLKTLKFANMVNKER